MIHLISLILDVALLIRMIISRRKLTVCLRFLSISILINMLAYYMILGLAEAFGYSLLVVAVCSAIAKLFVVCLYWQTTKDEYENISIYLLTMLLCLCVNENPSIGLISGLILLVFVVYTEYQENTNSEEKNEIPPKKENNIYLKTIEDSYRKNRALMHDLNNHIIVIRTLAENRAYDELLNYTDSMAEKVSENLFPVHSGNIVLDALLADKYHVARKNRIFVDFLNVRYNVYLDNGDLCTVIGNLFDNAIEENLKNECEEERRISVSICSNYDELCVTFTNPLFHVLKIQNGFPVSDKLNVEHHGMGLKNVRRVCDLYGGTFFWNDEGGIFTITVHLKMTRNP